MNLELEKLEEALGYSFRDRELLRRALTHKSLVFETNCANSENRRDNEQLEFLGDAVLGFIVSETLVAQFPSLSEGPLSKSKSYLVSADHLHEVALELDLGDYLYLGRGEEMNGGRTKRALLANSIEALIAAIYLDGGYDPARRFVLDNVAGPLDAMTDEEGNIRDYKGALQELAQGEKLPIPRYRIAGTSGPEHSKMFTVEVSVGPEWTARAEGTSKKTAGQSAAEILFEQMQQGLSGS